MMRKHFKTINLQMLMKNLVFQVLTVMPIITVNIMSKKSKIYEELELDEHKYNDTESPQSVTHTYLSNLVELAQLCKNTNTCFFHMI